MMEQMCPVCQTPIESVWICCHSKCPKTLQEKMKKARSDWRDKNEQFGKPEIKDDDPDDMKGFF
jgi:hypothetical protein